MTTGPRTTYAPYFLPAAALVAILSTSCAVAPGPGGEDQMPAERLQGRYTCKGLGQIDLRFSDSMGMVQMTYRNRTTHLRQERSGQVIVYSDGANTVRREGQGITVTLAGGEPTRCIHSTGPN